MVTSPYLHPALNTLAALLLAAGALIGVLQGADATVTQTLFGPGSTMLAAEPRAFWAWWLIILGAVPFIVWQWLPKLHDPERLVALTWPALVAGAGDGGDGFIVGVADGDSRVRCSEIDSNVGRIKQTHFQNLLSPGPPGRI